MNGEKKRARLDQRRAPIHEALENFRQMRVVPFDVPGHKRGRGNPELTAFLGQQCVGVDVNSMKPLDNLCHPVSVIREAEELAADAFGAAHAFLMVGGTTSSVQSMVLTACKRGDEIILPAPFWVSYYELIRMVGAVPVVLDATEASHFKLTAEQLSAAITPRTKALILNNPSNPTGMVYSREELQAIGRVCVEKDIYVIADEIYYHLIYDGKTFTSFPSVSEEVKERTILINGVSKSYAMTGWRIGYAAANEQIAKVMSNYLSHSPAAPCSIAQKAAVEALIGPQDTVDTMTSAFEARRDHLVERMNRIPGVSCLKPEGAFYIMMNLEQLVGKTLHGVFIRDADDFADAFLKHGLVATVPCTGFGAPNFVRWSYATSLQNIDEGLNRLEKFLAE